MGNRDKILLIGNGPSVMDKDLSAMIDHFPGPVVRFNDFRIQATHTGSRIDCLVTVEQYPGVKLPGIRKIFSSFKPHPNNDIYQKIKAKVPELEFFTRDTLAETMRMAEYPAPSTGAIAAYYFSEFFEEVWLHGFDHFDPDLPHHYSKDGHPKASHHDPYHEGLFFRKMWALGRTRYLDPDARIQEDPELTVIIPYLNEGQEVVRTIESIYMTSDPARVKIIAIDDSSDAVTVYPRKYPALIYHRTPERLGVDGSRTLGISMAETEYVMVMDAHMRAVNGWSQVILEEMAKDKKSVYCFGSRKLTERMRDFYGAKFIGHGANFALVNVKHPVYIMEPKWRLEKECLSQKADVQEIQCLLGGAYAMAKEWHDHIRGFEGLRSYGSSEPWISLKSYMAGGSVKYMRKIIFAHIYRHSHPYDALWPDIIYNKLFMLQILVGDDIRGLLDDYITESDNKAKARQMIKENDEYIQEMKEYYSKIFKYSFRDILSRWEIDPMTVIYGSGEEISPGEGKDIRKEKECIREA